MLAKHNKKKTVQQDKASGQGRAHHKVVANIALSNPSLLKRVSSFVIDLLIINIFLLIPFDKILEKLPMEAGIAGISESMSFGTELRSLVVMTTLAISTVAFLYFTIFDMVFNQSIGKMIMGIYVLPFPDNPEELKVRGIRIGVWKAVVRNLFIFPFFPFIILWIIDPIAALTSTIQQRFSERITKTRTVQLRAATAEELIFQSALKRE